MGRNSLMLDGGPTSTKMLPTKTETMPMQTYIDCHNHLQDESFDPDRPQTIQSAQDVGVIYSVVNGTSPSDWHALQDLAREYDHIIPCFGLHPWFVNKVQGYPWQDELRTFLDDTPSGIGEIGLDRWIKESSLENQVAAFRFQWTLAAQLDRPVMIHCLRAWGLLLEELQRPVPGPPRFLIHGFGGSAELIKPLAQLGAYFSFAGNALDTHKSKIQEALYQVPLERLLVETDAPDMPPPPDFRRPALSASQGRYRNEPANLPLIMAGLAALRPEAEEELIEAVEANSRCFLEGLLP